MINVELLIRAIAKSLGVTCYHTSNCLCAFGKKDFYDNKLNWIVGISLIPSTASSGFYQLMYIFY